MATKFQPVRFRRLIAAVEGRPNNKFDMRTWAKRKLRRRTGARAACGTVCCAAGSYVEAHPRCGMAIVFEEGVTLGTIVRKVGKRIRRGSPLKILAEHFGIDLIESGDIFLQSHAEETRKEVVSRYRRFLSDKLSLQRGR